jgi:hypothetical protein
MRRVAGILIIAGLAAPAAAPASTAPAAQLQAAQARWRHAHVRSYALRLHWCCADASSGYTGRSGEGDAVLIVQGGHARRHPATSFGRIRTIPDLFAIVRRNLTRDDLHVRFDPHTGVPLSFSFDTRGISDSRRAFTVTHFHRIPAH